MRKKGLPGLPVLDRRGKACPPNHLHLLHEGVMTAEQFMKCAAEEAPAHMQAIDTLSPSFRRKIHAIGWLASSFEVHPSDNVSGLPLRSKRESAKHLAGERWMRQHGGARLLPKVADTRSAFDMGELL